MFPDINAVLCRKKLTPKLTRSFALLREAEMKRRQLLTLRDECLNVHQFLSIADAKEKFEAWRRDYNQSRPHSFAHRGGNANDQWFP
jgi:transposase InsO family protein